jgi:outer membrane protein OmpA-like peptidoglycan-associated protein
MGGLDIFRATFDPKKLVWSYPANLGMQINSPLDDGHLVLSPDGMTAYLNSNRKEGYGDEDIYRVFFKQPVIAHQHISIVPTFYHSIKLAGNSIKNVPGQNVARIEIKEYYVSHLFFNDNNEILSPQNAKKLDLLANLLTIYPKVTAELSCFELPAGQRTYNLYFSIKKAEKAAEYLERRGIDRGRLLLKGYGASFPLVTKSSPRTQSPLYEKLNQRLEITPHDYETEPVELHIENIRTPKNLQDPHGAKFSGLRHNLFYSVQIASITQILQNQEIDAIEEMFIEVDNAQGNYLYMAGMLKTYKESEAMLLQMRSIGFHDARIIPYLNGIRITDDAVPDLTKQYPDLLFFLAGKGK